MSYTLTEPSDRDGECYKCVIGNELAHNHIGYGFVITSDNEVEYVTARMRGFTYVLNTL